MQQVREGPDGAYRFTLLQPQVFQIKPPSRPFANAWVRVSANGVLWIAEGYAWDGCSVVPDGPRGADGLPITWRASLLHDALYQFCIDNGTYTRAQADAAFRDEMRKAGCGVAWSVLYYAGVRLFGGLYHRHGDVPEPPAGT